MLECEPLGEDVGVEELEFEGPEDVGFTECDVGLTGCDVGAEVLVVEAGTILGEVVDGVAGRQAPA